MDVDCSVQFARREAEYRMYDPIRKRKTVRLLTVVAYMFSVSLAAIMLSAYYMLLWQQPRPTGAQINNTLVSGNCSCPGKIGSFMYRVIQNIELCKLIRYGMYILCLTFYLYTKNEEFTVLYIYILEKINGEYHDTFIFILDQRRIQLLIQKYFLNVFLDKHLKVYVNTNFLLLLYE